MRQAHPAAPSNATYGNSIARFPSDHGPCSRTLCRYSWRGRIIATDRGIGNSSRSIEGRSETSFRGSRRVEEKDGGNCRKRGDARILQHGEPEAYRAEVLHTCAPLVPYPTLICSRQWSRRSLFRRLSPAKKPQSILWARVIGFSCAPQSRPSLKLPFHPATCFLFLLVTDVWGSFASRCRAPLAFRERRMCSGAGSASTRPG